MVYMYLYHKFLLCYLPKFTGSKTGRYSKCLAHQQLIETRRYHTLHELGVVSHWWNQGQETRSMWWDMPFVTLPISLYVKFWDNFFSRKCSISRPCHYLAFFLFKSKLKLKWKSFHTQFTQKLGLMKVPSIAYITQHLLYWPVLSFHIKLPIVGFYTDIESSIYFQINLHQMDYSHHPDT